MASPSADQGPWSSLPENRPDTPPGHLDSTMASSPPYESPRPFSQEKVQEQAPPSPPAEEANTANQRAPRVPFWNESLVTTYNRIPQPVRPWWTGWSGYEGAAIGTGFRKGIKPVNAVQPHLPLRPLMTDVEKDKCFSRDELADGTTYLYSRTIPVILSRQQKKTLSRCCISEIATRTIAPRYRLNLFSIMSIWPQTPRKRETGPFRGNNTPAS